MNQAVTTTLFKSFFPEHILTFVSDCRQDFKLREDQVDLTDGQKMYLKQQLDFPFQEIFYNRQVHGKKIVTLTQSPFPLKALEEADAIVTNVANLPIAVRTADCLAVFIFDPEHHAIGIVHAGWKGTKEKISLEALNAMRNLWQANPEKVKVAFGPAVQKCCYEVGEEFEQHFPQEISRTAGKSCLDMPLVNKRQLLKAGVKEEHIFDCGVCTCCDKKYFSFRRDGEAAGRMIHLMMIRGN